MRGYVTLTQPGRDDVRVRVNDHQGNEEQALAVLRSKAITRVSSSKESTTAYVRCEDESVYSIVERDELGNITVIMAKAWSR